MTQDNKHIRYLAEHLLHTGVNDLTDRERHALLRIARKLQANRMQPQTLTADDLPALDPDCIGLHGSPTKVSRTFVPVRTKQTVRIDGAQPEAAVASLLA